MGLAASMISCQFKLSYIAVTKRPKSQHLTTTKGDYTHHAASPLQAGLWRCSLSSSVGSKLCLPWTQGDGAYNVMGLLAEAVVLPLCSLTFLPFSSPCSQYCDEFEK